MQTCVCMQKYIPYIPLSDVFGILVAWSGLFVTPTSLSQPNLTLFALYATTILRCTFPTITLIVFKFDSVSYQSGPNSQTHMGNSLACEISSLNRYLWNSRKMEENGWEVRREEKNVHKHLDFPKKRVGFPSIWLVISIRVEELHRTVGSIFE